MGDPYSRSNILKPHPHGVVSLGSWYPGDYTVGRTPLYVSDWVGLSCHLVRESWVDVDWCHP